MLNGVAKANNDYGYIGAAIVGMFVVVVGGWYITKRFWMMFFTVKGVNFSS